VKSYFQCSRFCLERAASCLKLARLNISPEHHTMFSRMATDWKHFANMCRGRWHLCIDA